MSQINRARTHDTKPKAKRARRPVPNRTRRPSSLLAYEGVTAAYVRDISRH